MDTSPYTPPSASFDTEPASIRTDSAFYVVSLFKLCLLFIGTLGYYTIYWHYKNWRCYRNSHPQGQEWPPARAIFQIFFIHDLFREVSEHAEGAGRPLAWNADLGAGIMIALIVAWGIVERLLTHHIGVVYNAIVWTVLGVALVASYCTAQRQINMACGDPRGQRNASVSWANCAWLVAGFATWLLFIAATLLVPA